MCAWSCAYTYVHDYVCMCIYIFVHVSRLVQENPRVVDFMVQRTELPYIKWTSEIDTYSVYDTLYLYIVLPITVSYVDILFILVPSNLAIPSFEPKQCGIPRLDDENCHFQSPKSGDGGWQRPCDKKRWKTTPQERNHRNGGLAAVLSSGRTAPWTGDRLDWLVWKWARKP